MKKTHKLKLINPHLFRRMFLRSAILLFVCIAVIVTAFFLRLQSLIRENYQQTEFSNTKAVLTQISENLNHQLWELNTRASEVLSNPQTASSLVTHLSSDNVSQLMNISTLLESYIQHNDLAEDAWIYLKLSDSVLSPSRGYLPLLDMEDFPRESLGHLEKAMDSGSLSLYRQGNSYYMVTTYPAHTSFGILVTKVNILNLYHQISASIRSSADRIVYLYGSENEAIFPTLLNYPSEKELQVSDLLFEDNCLKIYDSPSKDSLICLYTMPATDWHWVQIIPASLTLPANGAIFLQMLPFLLLSLLVIIVFSIYMIRSTYAPLYRVISRLVQPDSGDRIPSASTDTTNDTWAVIEQNLQDNLTEQQNITSILQEVNPAIHSKLFHRLTTGDIPQTMDLEELLQQLNSPFPIRGNYLVLAVQAMSHSQELDEISRNIFTLSIRSFIERYWSSRCRCLNIQESIDSGLLVILCLENDFPQAQLQLSISDFQDQLKLSTKDLAFYPQLGRSNTITELTELHKATLEAQKDLHYRTYFQNNPEKFRSPDHTLEENFFRSQMLQLLQRYKEASPPDSEEIRSFLHSATLEAQPAQPLYQIHSVILEELLHTGTPLESLSFLSRRHMEDRTTFLSPEDTIAYLSECIPAAGAYLLQKAQRDQNNYVEQAKRFIAENYADSNLSQEMVCSHIGISTPYFSALFAEQEKQNFLNFVHQYRIEQARQLLFATDLTIAEIGFRTGFNSANSFIRVFKKLMNETPGKYRERIRKAQ